MHPFFKPGATKQIRRGLEPQTDQPDKDLGREQSRCLQPPNQHAPSESTNPYNSDSAFDSRDVEAQSDKHLETENIDIDPNSERKKRRKTTPFQDGDTASSQTEEQASPDGEGSWLAQLRAAADSYSPDVQEQPKPGNEDIRSPPTPLSASPLKLSIRHSPTKTPAKAYPAVNAAIATPPAEEFSSERSRNFTGKDSPPPASNSTPKKKLIKISAKGKLLSSPPSVSPASKRKIKGKPSKPPGKSTPSQRSPTCLSYGSDEISKKRIGSSIDLILSRTTKSSVQTRSTIQEAPKTTHPFFSGKPFKGAKSEALVFEDDSITGQDSEASSKVESAGIKPKDWKDLGFKKHPTAIKNAVEAVRVIWPPKDMQHLGLVAIQSCSHKTHSADPIRKRLFKSKSDFSSIPDDQNILHKLSATMRQRFHQSPHTAAFPQKTILSRQIIMSNLTNKVTADQSSTLSNALQDQFPQAFDRLHSIILSGPSLRDKVAPGMVQSWLANSAPRHTGEVLQADSSVLRQWLASHQVHHALTKFSNAPKMKAPRKRQRRKKKKAEEFDDFIATSDEDEGSPQKTKNAILITGPSGCGKTASVYAVAQELDFEVFEIHPGMRRSAKDIFEKVGDMTQNHLVQKAGQLDRSRDSTPNPLCTGTANEGHAQGVQKALNFLGRKDKSRPTKEAVQSQSSTPNDDSEPKSQKRKQSLILFEEVDILFEEDRGFWNGVIQLLEQSKRPAVFTCNDSSSIPAGDLPLHAILEYEYVPVDVAVDYLLMVAAAEGHWLQRGAILSLYLAKQMDLRASISEVNFWCQMGVGSEKAGLDWTIEARPSDEALKPVEDRLRLLSKDTYTSGLGLVPGTLLQSGTANQGVVLQYAKDELDIPLQYWCENGDAHDDRNLPSLGPQHGPLIKILQHYEKLSETKSAFDLLENQVDNCSKEEEMGKLAIGADLAARTLTGFSPRSPFISAEEIVFANLNTKAASSEPLTNTLPTAFEPLATEKPQFPVSSGRLAPSLETRSKALMIDSAPYIRSIIRYDQRLEEQREALAGHPSHTSGKARKTRASRAALEGGSKASTRGEKWFPRQTDYAGLLQTGGAWPVGEAEAMRPYSASSSRGSESRTESTATSPTGDTEMKYD